MFGLLVTVAEIQAIFQAWFDNALRFLPQIAFGVAVFVLAVFAAKIARHSAERTFTRVARDERAGNAWGTIVRYVVLFLGLVTALAVAGVDLSAMMLAVGAIGFGLAFAMQNTIANLVSGLIVLTTHPFARGDAVEINGAQGKVEEIKIRATKIRTFDGLKIEVPNKAVVEGNITVFSYHPTRRFDVAVGIGYDDDIEGAMETAREAASGVEDVLGDPAPETFVSDLGGSSVNLNVRFWVQRTDRATMLEIKGDVARAVKEALVDAGYDIPYPIRTVYMHEMEPSGNGSGDGRAAPSEPSATERT